ncbi:MAG: D-alanyl-D-alanine carboxypeptidase [bacterium]|nr:D-alanyl-D-alanine carboxypeptidase [bacterium]
MVLLLPALNPRTPNPDDRVNLSSYLNNMLSSLGRWLRLLLSFKKGWQMAGRGLAIIIIAAFIFQGKDSITAVNSSVPQEAQKSSSPTRVFSSLIEIPLGPERLTEVAAPETIAAKAALVTDLATGEVMLEKEAKLPLPPASTTKIITALIALENYSLGEVVTVNPVCGSLTKDQSQMGLVAEEKITVENLLYGLLVQSASDAACALAQAFPGGEVEFVAAMNSKAKNLGMNQTTFSNPSGNDTDESAPHFSSAWDLTIAAKEALKSATFRQIVGTKEINLSSFDQKYWHLVRNTNELLFTFPGTVGVKTGYTEKALGCLVLDYALKNHEVLVVVLGSQDRFGEARSLAEWAFKAYKW